jgi:nucleoid-associated protein YgaU
MFKQSSTAILLAFSLFALVASAQQSDPRRTGNVLELRPDAPDTYAVQRGDTLWDISGKFMKEPWRWPQIWRLNKDQIRNPHLIYPGNVVRLDRTGPTLALDSSGTSSGRMQPRARAEALAVEAIPTIPYNVIEPFLSQPLVVERGGLDRAPRIVAMQEGRYNIGAGSRAYVSGMGDTKEPLWQVYRPGSALVDPETKQTLGYEAIFLGDARLTRTGDPATVQVVSSKREIGEGDRLAIAVQPQVFSFAPRAPAQDIRGRIVSVYDGRTDARTDFYRAGISGSYQNVDETGTLAVVAINRGAKHGLEPGHVLAIHRSFTVERDRSTGPFYMGEKRPEPIQLPEERYGLMMVFRVFENLSYALTLQAERPVGVGDVVTQP